MKSFYENKSYVYNFYYNVFYIIDKMAALRTVSNGTHSKTGQILNL